VRPPLPPRCLAPVAVTLAGAAVVVALVAARAVADVAVVIATKHHPLRRRVGVEQHAPLASALLVPLRAPLQAGLDGRHGLAVGLVHLGSPVLPADDLPLPVALGVLCEVAHLFDAVCVDDEHAKLPTRELDADRLTFQVGVTSLVVLDDAVLVDLFGLDDRGHGPPASAVTRAGDLDLREELLQVGQTDLLQALGVRVSRQLLAAEVDPQTEPLVGGVGLRGHELRLLVALARLLLGGVQVGVVLLVGVRHC